MTSKQTLELKLSEARAALNGIAASENPEDAEKIDGMLAEYQALEKRYQAAVVAEAAVEAVVKPADHPVHKASIGKIFESVVENRSLDGGAEAELQQEYGLGGDQIPLELIIEERAVTPAPTNTGASEQSVVQPVFSTGDIEYLAVAQKRVPAGDATYPVLTTRPTVGGPHKDGTDAPETTGAFTSVNLAPSRIQASFYYLRSDAARFSGMDAALRMALNSALSEALDAQLIAQIVTDVARVDASTADGYASYRKRLIDSLVDGRFARDEKDIKLLVGAATFGALAAAATTISTGDASAADNLRRISNGLRVSPLITAPASAKQDVLVRLGTREDASVAVWNSITLLSDPFTRSGSGEIELSAILLAAWKITRPAGFRRIQVQHA